MSEELSHLLVQAIALARSGGEIARARLGSAVASQKHDNSIVTDVDHAVQAHVVDAVAQRFPDHAVITEEALAQPQRHAAFDEAEWCWVIDPIDGTRNYARGLPGFSISIAVLRRGEPVVGAVYAVIEDQMYSAQQGGGAWCDGRRLHVADEPPTGDTVVGTPSGGGDPMPAWAHAMYDDMTLRNFGSAALHLAMVAAGAFDAAFCIDSKLWDIAAGALLVTEAGGVVTDLRGAAHFPVRALRQPPRAPVLAAGPNLHRYLFDTRLRGR